MTTKLQQSDFVPTLNKQIDRYFSTGVNEENLSAFLKVVNETYQWFERDKLLSEHAYAVSEKEYQDAVSHLESQHDIIRQSVGLLKDAIQRIDKNAVLHVDDAEAEIINVVRYLNKQLEVQRNLEQQLIVSKEFAEKAAQVKSDFLSVMSHEIKTPLNAIIGLSHLLQQQQFTHEQARNINALHAAAENLLSLVNDILDFNKIEEGKIQLAPRMVDLRVILNNLKYAYALKANEKQTIIKLTIDENLPAHILVDDVRLNQVLHNLMSNAVKFTNKGQVWLSVMVEPSSNEEHIQLRFSIKDSGIGIAKEKQHLIFDHFTQADSNITRQYGGSGLGLSIVKRILQLMNSHIDLQSAPGKGAAFSFVLSLPALVAGEPQNAPHPDKKLHHDFSGINVLVVDDIEFNVMVAEQMLTNCNASCSHAADGIEAVKMARTNHFDLILMDLQMPHMDGFEATRRIREFNTTTPVVALTASSEPEVIIKAKVLGMDDYLMKPFNPNDFYNMVAHYSGYVRG